MTPLMLKKVESAYVRYTGYENGFLALKGIFLAGKSDYDGAHLFRLETAISGEIFADFVCAREKCAS